MEKITDIKKIAYPRQAILVTSEADIEMMGKKITKKNIFTLAWHMPTSFEPMMYAISVGKERFSYQLIKKSGVFCVNFMPFDLKEKVLFCGRNSGRIVDKFRKTGLTEAECEKIHCPKIKEAIGWLECSVVDEVDTGDHVIIIGEVLNAQLRKEGRRVFHKGGDEFTTTGG